MVIAVLEIALLVGLFGIHQWPRLWEFMNGNSRGYQVSVCSDSTNTVFSSFLSISHTIFLFSLSFFPFISLLLVERLYFWPVFILSCSSHPWLGVWCKIAPHSRMHYRCHTLLWMLASNWYASRYVHQLAKTIIVSMINVKHSKCSFSLGMVNPLTSSSRVVGIVCQCRDQRSLKCAQKMHRHHHHHHHGDWELFIGSGFLDRTRWVGK